VRHPDYTIAHSNCTLTHSHQLCAPPTVPHPPDAAARAEQAGGEGGYGGDGRAKQGQAQGQGGGRLLPLSLLCAAFARHAGALQVGVCYSVVRACYSVTPARCRWECVIV
jgi:hypothetical protein